MDILTWSPSADSGMLVDGWLTEEKNCESKGAQSLAKGGEHAWTHTTSSSSMLRTLSPAVLSLLCFASQSSL